MQYEQTNIQMQDERVTKHNRRANLCVFISILCLLLGFGQMITDGLLLRMDSEIGLLYALSIFGMPLIAGICGFLGIVYFAISESTNHKARRIIGLSLSIIGIILDVLCFIIMIMMLVLYGVIG